jgi:chromosome partitioning protein
MVILTVAHTKGGVGKSTLAFELALIRAKAGRDVWLVDADPQGSALTAATVRAEAGRTPVLAASASTSRRPRSALRSAGKQRSSRTW